MKISRTTTRVLLLVLASLVILVTLGSILLPHFLDLDTYKAEIISQLQKAIERPVFYAKGEFSLVRGPSFSFQDVEIKEKGEPGVFLSAQKLSLRLSLLNLLRKKIVITEVTLTRPAISLIRYRSGRFNISDLLERKDDGSSLSIKDIQLSHATIRLVDQAVIPEGISTTLKETDLVLDNLERGRKTTFKLSGILQDRSENSEITLGGTARLPIKGHPWTATEIHAKLLAKGVQPGNFWPYYSRFVPFQKITGKLDLNLSFKGKPTAFVTSGDVKIAGLNFNYPQVFHAVLNPEKLHLQYHLERTPTAVKISSFSLNVDNLKVKGSCDILATNSRDPRIVARATSSPFRLEEFRGYIPYGIIIKDTADYIEQHIMGGIFRLDEGRLEGTASQIANMGVGDNYKVLFIRGHVERGLLTYGPKVPTFNSIKGELLMEGKDFILRGMSAKFGNAPFTLDGRITELYDPVPPCTYPFTMTIKPTQAEIAWLLGQTWGKNLTFSGDSTLKLSGSGTTGLYQLEGDWDLTPAAYSYPDMINKPSGRANTALFKGSISREEMKLTSLRYSLAPMIISLAADYRYRGKPWLGLDIQTNRFPIHEVAPMIPMAGRYQTAGFVQTAVQAKAASGNPQDLSWKGTVAMSGCSLKPSDDIKPLRGINGTIIFSGSSLESSDITALLGNSIIHGKGTLSGFSNPSLYLDFSSPLFDPSDLGLKTPGKGLKIARLAGTISYRDNQLQIGGVSGQVNNTILMVRGSVQELRSAPKFDLSVASPHLEVDDIILLSSLERGKPSATPVSAPVIRATVTAESAKFLDIPFSQLKGVVMYDNRILYLQPLEAGMAGGRISGTARIDLGHDGAARMQTSYKLENASAERLFKLLGAKNQEVRGTISIQGELSSKGITVADIKRTALGSAKLRIEEGSLRRFATLSKIFSILNLSQLLKFQLPDMVSGGMPYNEIRGNFSIKDGIVSTSDLYVDSDAINISAIGTLNLSKDELNATIGVKPLQTIDKVVSRIPIVGWILTGKDKSLVTAYFEAKGKLDDPVVRAIPVKGMAKGVLNIFIRIFELPAKMVTDTGEVVTGK